eukprot:g73655.t1
MYYGAPARNMLSDHGVCPCLPLFSPSRQILRRNFPTFVYRQSRGDFRKNFRARAGEVLRKNFQAGGSVTPLNPERLRVMPSKKKRAAKVDGENAPNPVFTLGQRLDKTKLKRISMLYAVVGQEELQVNELLESCKLNRPEVDYMPGIHDSKGRAYGQNSIGNLPKWIMRIVSGAMYESLDICNAAASILVQLADREQAAVPVLFSRFVHGGREDMQKLLLEQVGKEDNPLNRKWAKKQFNSVINQKSVLADYAIDCPLMRDWAQACKSLGEQLKRFTAFGDVWALVQSLDDKPNKLATFISYVYQRFELQIMLEVMKYCSAQNIQVGVYKYDELLVESDMHKGGPQ